MISHFLDVAVSLQKNEIAYFVVLYLFAFQKNTCTSYAIEAR